MNRVLLAGYDGTSRVPGTSLGPAALWNVLAEEGAAERASPLSVTEESKNSAFWCRKIARVVAEHPVKLTLGGEHLVSFPVIETLASKHPGLRVVVLDAHHDAYDFPLLTHYSLFHYVRHELALETLIVGARHELEQMPEGCIVVDGRAATNTEETIARMRAFVDGAPFYFSVDLDVLDPTVFAPVSDPVPGGITVAQLTTLTRAMLDLGPVAVDVVEYNALLDRSGEHLRELRQFFVEIAGWLSRAG
jgi:arginase family enzyme